MIRLLGLTILLLLIQLNQGCMTPSRRGTYNSLQYIDSVWGSGAQKNGITHSYSPASMVNHGRQPSHYQEQTCDIVPIYDTYGTGNIMGYKKICR